MEDGPDHQKVYYVTAKCEPFDHFDNRVLSFQCVVHGHTISSGRGVTIGNAKQIAASQALNYLRSLPGNHPLFSLQ